MYAGTSLSKLTADKLNIKEQNHMSDSGKLVVYKVLHYTILHQLYLFL